MALTTQAPSIVCVYAHRPEAAPLAGRLREGGIEADLYRYRSPADLHGLYRRLSRRRPGLLLNVGFAGALNPAVGIGSVCSISKIVDEAGKELWDHSGRAPAGAAADSQASATLLTTCRAVDCQERREELRRRTGADLVDMEAGAVCETALALGVEFASLKIVSDTAGSNAADQVRRGLDALADKLGAAAFELIKRWTERGGDSPASKV